jgi:5-methylcytosine-specific restriction endonuclease McrBC regulatory subunit McrC
MRGYVRWALERVRSELVSVGQSEPVARALIQLASHLLQDLNDVQALRPRSQELSRVAGSSRLLANALRQGLQALGWVVDERGLGGGQEMDGLAWQLPLEQLWERYVEAKIREEVAREGGDLTVGRLGQTVFPLQWSTNTARSMTHLVPDIVVRKGRTVHIVDAKYKAHFADLDEFAWMKLANEIRDAHRADVHQVLAYASLYDAEDVTATLVYPLRQTTWEALRERGRDHARADLFHGSRRVRLELRGLPFGKSQGTQNRH